MPFRYCKILHIRATLQHSFLKKLIMKIITLCFIACCMICHTEVFSQNITGRMMVSGIDRGAVLKEKTPVQLFKSFKDDRYRINFTFSSKDLPKNGIVLFDMNTTVKLNGKMIGSASRDGWPWLPGDMYVPVEAFDFIPILQKQATRQKGRSVSAIPSGEYEVVLEMKPSSGQEISGSIRPAIISFNVQK